MADSIKINKGRVKMVAHRGLSGIETENTNLAFVAAGNRSYFGIETDVHVTADGELIIIHDSQTGRVSDVEANVEQSDFSYLRSVKLRDREDGATRDDIILPALDDYIKICRRYGKVCVLEIKTPFTREQLEKTLAVIKARDYLKNVVFISFHLENLLILREITPTDQRLQFLCGELSDETIALLRGKKIDIDIHYPTLLAHPEYMKKFRDAGLEVNCWTVDSPADAEKVIELGVDYITSNILE